MEAYRYRAARQDGRIVRGVIEATGSPHATTVLVERGLHPLVIERAEPEEVAVRAAGRRELAIVFRSIAALVAAGVPLERAVGASEQLGRGTLRDALAQARDRIREGRSLAQALEASRGVVPALVIGMVRAGERGSRLGSALEQVAQQLEQEADLVGRVRQALAYPAMLAVVGTASVLLIATVVVPKFAALLEDVGSELPTTTRLLLRGSTFVSDHALLLGLSVIAAGVTAASWVRRPEGRRLAARGLFALPVIGPLRLALATARWGRALAGMLAAGMPLLEALRAAREATGDPAVAERLDRGRDRVAQGRGLSVSLEREKALTSSALQLLAVGESSGQLATMAMRAGDLAAVEAERGLRALVSLLEPALVVTFGGLVAFVAAALLQAIYSLRPGGM